MFSFNEYLFFASAYLIGSIPFGMIVAKLAGIGDITKQGSGNIGATNIARVGGRKLGAVTFVLDFLKGCLPTMLYIKCFGVTPGVLICALLVVIGHILSVFNRFKGGKGVATGLGVLFTISPFVCLATIVLWLVVFGATRISSAAALFSFTMMPFVFYSYDKSDKNLMAFAITLSLVIYITHFNNIKRLLNGKENGFK